MAKRELTKDDSTLWCVYDHGRTFYKFELALGPTTKEEAEYYLGRCPHYELVELKVVSRRFGNQGKEES